MSSRTTGSRLGFRIECLATLRLAMPIIFGMVLQNSLGLIDTLMVGRVSVEAVAACAFANALFTVPLVFGFGVLGAVSVIVAGAAAKNDFAETAQILRRGMVLSLGLALGLVGGIVLLCAHLGVFHQPPQIIMQARGFLLLLACSLVPMYLFQTLKQYCEALRAAWIPMLILLSSVALNTGLNWIFIYGHLGFPALGLLGAGWATLITRISMFLVLVLYVARRFFGEMDLRESMLRAPFHLEGFRSLLRLGMPVGFQVVLEVGAFAVVAVMMGWISETALAAHQVAISASSISFMFPLGLSTAVAIRISHAVGSGLPRQARQAAQGSLMMITMAMACSTLLILAFAPIFAGLFVRNIQVISLAAHILIITGFLQIFDGIQVVSLGALRGLHDVKIPTLLNFCSYWLVGLPSSYFLAFSCRWGALGVWWGLLIGIGLVSGLLFWRLQYTLRRYV